MSREKVMTLVNALNDTDLMKMRALAHHRMVKSGCNSAEVTAYNLLNNALVARGYTEFEGEF